MELRKHFKTLAIVGLLVGLPLACFPASASASGYYMYIAQDMDIDNGDWTSEFGVTRMHFHPWTPGGTGAAISCRIPGKDFTWIDEDGRKQYPWFFLFDEDYDGVWEGSYTTKDGYVLKAAVRRFRLIYQRGSWQPDWITGTDRQGDGAYVYIDVYKNGARVHYALGWLKYHDSFWW